MDCVLVQNNREADCRLIRWLWSIDLCRQACPGAVPNTVHLM